MDIITDSTIGDDHARFNQAPGTNFCFAAQMNIRVDDRVGTNLDIDVDVAVIRVDQGHPFSHQLLVDPLPHNDCRFGQLTPVINPHDFLLVNDQGRDSALFIVGRGNDVGQVILILGIVITDRLQGCEYPGGFKGVNSGINLTDQLLLSVRIFLLDDGCNLVTLANNPAIAGRIINNRRQQRDRGLFRSVHLQHCRKGLLPQQRNISTEQQNCTIKAGQSFFGTQ